MLGRLKAEEKRVRENEMVGWHHKWQWSFILDISGVSPWALEKSIYWLLGEKCSCLENPRDGGAWWPAVYGVTQSRTWLKWLSSSSSSRREGWLPSAFQNPLQAALNRIEEANESSNSHDLRWPLWVCLWLDLTWGIYTQDLAHPCLLYYYLFSWIQDNTAVMPSPHCLVSKIDTNVHPPLFWGGNITYPWDRHNSHFKPRH